MKKQLKPGEGVKVQVSKILLVGAIVLTTLAPFVVNAAAPPKSGEQEASTTTPTPTPTPSSSKPINEMNVSWNT